jgi:hypothetical protein
MTRITVLLLLFACTQVVAQRSAYIFVSKSPPVEFAADKINRSLLKEGFRTSVSHITAADKTDVKIVLSLTGDSSWIRSVADTVPMFVDAVGPEGFSIQKLNSDETILIFVSAKDVGGLMYGGLELAEIIRSHGFDAVTDQVQNPYMKKRGVKMNIPLDVRTPSYTDVSDAAQNNIPEMWNMDFWKEYLDSLASYRFNFVSLWSLHPFPSLVKVPEYPDVALSDVHRSKAAFKEYYSTRATGFDAPEIVNNYEVVKKISIEEKIKFWQEVMQYGKDRNISFFFVTWNIYTGAAKGKHGITDDINNPVTKDYYRKSVKQLFITYPLLAGIGLTTGENMPGSDFQTKEDWAFDTYGQGVMDVTKIQTGRKITLIHRQHEAGARDIVKRFAPLIENKNINFVFSFKYAQAHVYSATTQIHHQEFVKQIQGTKGIKTLWTLRNDDVYYFRWGSPDFVREFMKNIPTDVTEGYYYGSDQYVWGREFLDKYPAGKRQIEIAKHWYQWMLWGRLGYSPDVSNERFIAHLQIIFPQTDAKQLFDAWQSASNIYPLTTGFHYGALDFQWYIEACKSRPEPAQTASGFHDINRFITLPPYKATGFISIPDYVKMKMENQALQGKTPLEVASTINTLADHALRLVKTPARAGSDELSKTIEDIKAISYLGKYYAHKINAATYLGLYNRQASSALHESIVNELNISALYWRYFASTALARYKNPLWTNRVGHVDWKNLYQYVVKDIVDQHGEVSLSNMDPTPGGMVLESESAELENLREMDEIKAFTGSGYVSPTHADNKITWNYQAPATGDYVLEFRYISDNRIARVPVYINNAPSSEIILWSSGSAENWVWDKIEVKLSKGDHSISIKIPEEIILDHLNIYRR